MATDLHPLQERGTDRVEALTDGVFAIVLTILVLALRPPTGPVAALGSELRSLVPALLVYLLTFLVVAGMWFRHHIEYDFVMRADRWLVWLNLLFLAFVALVPWSASLLGTHPLAPLAVLVYNLNLAAATAMQQLAWLYATRAARVAPVPMSPKLVAWSRVIGFLPVLDYLLAAGLSAVVPAAALGLDLLVPVAYLTGALFRLLFLLTR